MSAGSLSASLHERISIITVAVAPGVNFYSHCPWLVSLLQIRRFLVFEPLRFQLQGSAITPTVGLASNAEVEKGARCRRLSSKLHTDRVELVARAQTDGRSFLTGCIPITFQTSDAAWYQ